MVTASITAAIGIQKMTELPDSEGQPDEVYNGNICFIFLHRVAAMFA